MKTIEGNIIDIVLRKIIRGRVFYNDKIIKIEEDTSVVNDCYILPGLVDAHVHIESSMLTPLEYSKVALRHGVIAAVTDPHEIANVCGMDGIRFMIKNAKSTPMKIYFGAPSCVPATNFETSGARLSPQNIDELLKDECSHLSEMMNFPGVICDDQEVTEKLTIAKKHNKIIDGHAPGLSGYQLKKYINSGISTDHECTNIYEAKEKIHLGMKIMLRQSSASRDFEKLIELIRTNSKDVMLCTDDCHPDDLEKGYINELVKTALNKGYDLFDVLICASLNAIKHYNLNVGLLQRGDAADFIVVDNLNDFIIQQTVIDGEDVFIKNNISFEGNSTKTINNFYKNSIIEEDIKILRKGDHLNVIEIIEDSLITKKLIYRLDCKLQFIESSTRDDILKIVVVNRYQAAPVSVGFIKGFQLKNGAISSSISHDSHNIIAIGANDKQIISAINEIQRLKGGLVVVGDNGSTSLPLTIAGLMSTKSCPEVAKNYQILTKEARQLGCKLKSPFMTLAFMSLLVIPELKLGDKGLFDGNEFRFIDLQY